MKIINYHVVSTVFPDNLGEEVERFLRMGYEPYGNPFGAGGEIGQSCQAMVKYEELEPKECCICSKKHFGACG